MRDLIEDSYDLVVSKLPKRAQAELGWPRGTIRRVNVALREPNYQGLTAGLLVTLSNL